jgi:hypothetical protein
MTSERAFEINSHLVKAWMIRECAPDEQVPDLSSVSLTEAIEASRIVSETPPVPREDGGMTLTCYVESSRIPRLYVWALNKIALARSREDTKVNRSGQSNRHYTSHAQKHS